MTLPVFAFFIDAPEKLKPASDTSIVFMQAVQQRGYQVAYFTMPELTYLNGTVKAQLHFIKVNPQQTTWHEETHQASYSLNECHAVIIRKDPPFDEQYLYATYLLDWVAQQGVLVSNSSQSIRDCNEKLFATHFAKWMPATLISQNIAELTDFLNQHKKIVLKPLNAMAGYDVIIAEAGHLGSKSLLNLMTQHQQRMILAQQYLPQVQQGDKRILLINGEPLPYSLLRIPAKDDFRANLAIGGSSQITTLTEQEKALCDVLKPELQKRQLHFVGIDVIDGMLTEINVTSPTGTIPIMAETDLDVGQIWLDTLLNLSPIK